MKINYASIKTPLTLCNAYLLNPMFQQGLKKEFMYRVREKEDNKIISGVN